MQKWALFALGSAFFAALTAIFGKLGVEGINSNMATLIRTVVIFFVILSLVLFRHEWEKLSLISGHSWIFLILSGIATGLSWLCYYRALQLGEVSKVAPMDKLSVVFVILLGIVVLGEKLTWVNFVGGLLVFCGGMVLVLFG
jgi:transporter family protein